MQFHPQNRETESKRRLFRSRFSAPFVNGPDPSSGNLIKPFRLMSSLNNKSFQIMVIGNDSCNLDCLCAPFNAE